MTRRTGIRALAAVALAGVGAGVATLDGGAAEQAAAAAAAAPGTTAKVGRRDLITREDFDGTLGYDDSRDVASRLRGTVTSIRSEGETVRRGHVLFRVDDVPVVLLYGRQPAWRTLRGGVADGEDVRQLERNLVALGHDPDRDIEIDREFDWATRAAVRRWQEALGVSRTGEVEHGRVVFLPGPRRVASVRAVLGSEAGGGAVMTTTATTSTIRMSLDARRQDLVRVGQRVRVELPGGRVVAGVISRVGTVAKAGKEEGDPATVDVEVRLRRGGGRAVDGGPVTVKVVTEAKRGALAVPVTALVALSGGGYALEVDRAGQRTLVPVTPGAFADGYVEVSGRGVTEGTRVVVAS